MVARQLHPVAGRVADDIVRRPVVAYHVHVRCGAVQDARSRRPFAARSFGIDDTALATVADRFYLLRLGDRPADMSLAPTFGASVLDLESGGGGEAVHRLAYTEPARVRVVMAREYAAGSNFRPP